ncbi:putative integral membrane protein PTH11-like [Aspergillus novofumigatus IBT 16806]|uniref:Uncharacterized protein n=1 Tax=Aspergillus novofumigatus (strain IBT 16806) TaxID=1392255 RepID=A0A2I1CPX9_ASPN1|nr:uncharacterized protein P174DRAFT_427819 [Aspergillus novofumigatus IBT 16806]PKX99671.1 hypothetical protein P174DRAFT_427819 [Aspergillus novofumigatus IBT 16806]
MSCNRKIALSLLFSVGLALVLPPSRVRVRAHSFVLAGRVALVLVDFPSWIAGRPSNDAGAGVPLGILSAWEPLGGIFCANLPIIYRPVVTMSRNLKGYASGEPSRTHSPDLQEQCQ